jgi:hypothetical protein
MPQDGDFTYETFTPGFATITAYTGSNMIVTIPDTLGGYPVIAIGDSAFAYNSIMTHVTIPNSATSIGDAAFYQCISLTSVTLPPNLESIGDSAFTICPYLYSIIIPDSVTYVGYYAFSSCASLTSITLPKNIDSISGGMFYGCISLESIIIPDGVTEIGERAFEFCNSLETITLPRNVRIIWDYTFQGCVSLTSIIILGEVYIIGSNAFQSCINLTSIIFFGLVAPTDVGSDWIYITSDNIRGYALAESNFPAIGDRFNGLLMGILVDFSMVQTDKTTRTYTFSPLYDVRLDPCNSNVSYLWQFGGGGESTEKNPTHSFLGCPPFSVSLSISYVGITDSTIHELESIKEVIPYFEIYNNYGKTPLNFHVEDVTDYECTGFLPARWTWYIIYFGCLVTKYGYGNSMNMTITVPGQYGVMMTVSDGSRSYSIIRREVIFVSDINDSDDVQLELAHENGPENRRHLIKTTNDFTDPEKNSIQFCIWGTELSENDVAENILMIIRGDDKVIIKNMHPKSNLIYNIGSELQRWEELVSKDANILSFTEAGTLKLWSGR